MQLLLGLFLFSVLLATGSSLECEVCSSATADCSGPKQKCPGSSATCLTLKSEISEGLRVQSTIKSCSTEDVCKKFEALKGKVPTGQLPNVPADMPNLSPGAVIKEVVCSKASTSFASFFPAFFGLVLMKLLF